MLWLSSFLLLPICTFHQIMRSKLLNLVNYVSERDLYPPLVLLTPVCGPATSYRPCLSRSMLCGAGCSTELLPVPVIKDLEAAVASAFQMPSARCLKSAQIITGIKAPSNAATLK